MYEPPDDAFLMVTQEHWEDKVLLDTPYTPATPLSAGGGGSLWRPNNELAFSRQLSSSREGVLGDGGPPRQSLFPIENYELVYTRWEDNVIVDCEAMDHIPPPSIPQIDPNDPNFVIGIPEEPLPVVTTGDREGGRKVCSHHLRGL